MNPKLVLATIGIIAAVVSLFVSTIPLLPVAVIFIGVATLL